MVFLIDLALALFVVVGALVLGTLGVMLLKEMNKKDK